VVASLPRSIGGKKPRKPTLLHHFEGYLLATKACGCWVTKGGVLGGGTVPLDPFGRRGVYLLASTLLRIYISKKYKGSFIPSQRLRPPPLPPSTILRPPSPKPLSLPTKQKLLCADFRPALHQRFLFTPAFVISATMVLQSIGYLRHAARSGWSEEVVGRGDCASTTSTW